MAETRVTNSKLIFGFFVVLYVSTSFTFGADTISTNQIIRYNDTIVSPQETFELGFFSPDNSINHYVGIWYKKRAYRTYVWVANRDAPLAHTSGELTLTLQGVLVLWDATTGNVLWNSSSKITVRNPISQLLDTGNLIIYEEDDDINEENHIWQSFDFLTGTFLPGMKLGMNLVTGFERRFTSWKSDDDPAAGNFSYWIDTRGYPQAILTEGQDIKFRAGPWNGLRSTGFPYLRPNKIYNYTFVNNQKEVYFQFDLINTLVLMRLVLQPNGRLERLLWDENKQKWNIFLAPEVDLCEQYAVCGPNGMCNINNSPVCECLQGFEPRFPDRWNSAHLSQGCRHTIPLDCGPGEGFNKYSKLKFPDTQGSWYNQTMTLVEYRNSSIAIGNKETSRAPNNVFEHDPENRSDNEDLELPLFGLSMLLKATNNFSTNNKIGEGGYGPVYKGIPEDRKEIAVKRLAKTSTQGLQEFKNEVTSISKLQHRNLVKLLGYCIEAAGKMLIYEYMPNKSLDFFIFDRTQSELIDWTTRYYIINGIARVATWRQSTQETVSF
ncbi:G-type lectin S-receptor-like serine/threonine-protein kinase At4g27290 [Bidens hawaiensis]|uniref:G-type lectin S-receptor-like serine/threonine-protein kinase At4g27290 n=1 Tax=Bidens hawaiensis TaxID=980011 RepID=UPI004048EC44